MSDEYEKRRDRYKNTPDENRPDNYVGVFYDLFGKELLYHEKALFYMLSHDETQKKLLEALFGEEYKQIDAKDEDKSLITDLKMEEVIEEAKRIDLFFRVKICEVETPVILELKTDTDNHGGQLTFYFKHHEDKKRKISPRLFYITPDGRKPVAEGEKEEVIKKTECKSYFELVKDIPLINQTIIVCDYVNTVKIMSNSEKSNHLLDRNLIEEYACFFHAINDLLCKQYGIATGKIEINYKLQRIYARNTNVDISSIDDMGKIIGNAIGASEIKYFSISLIVDDSSKGSLSIERRWDRDKEEDEFRNSMYYGIRYPNCERIKSPIWTGKYRKLISRWIALGRTTNAREDSKGNIKRSPCQRAKRLNNDVWYVVQFLTDWVMLFCDKKEPYFERNDAYSWAKWIKEDFDLIDK